MSYSDSHIHLVDYSEVGVENLLAKMAARDIGLAVSVATSVDSSEASLKLARRHSSIVPAIGIHPWFAGRFDAAARTRLEELAASGNAKMLGEIGLDYSPPDALLPGPPPGVALPPGVKMPELPSAWPSPEVQREVFVFQLGLAKRYVLPVNLHYSHAHKEILELLWDPEYAGISGIAHDFEGDPVAMREWLEAGFLIALSSHRLVADPMPYLVDVVREIPLDRFVVESDANPMMSPDKGSLEVMPVLQRMAEIRGVEPETLASMATANLKRLLNLSA
jgi:TatD DNase family protein